MSDTKENKKRTTKPKKNKTKIIILSLLAAILAIVIGTGGFVYYNINKINTKSIAKDDTSLGITPNEGLTKDVVNIALFGVDQAEGTKGRSDAIIVLTLDTKNKLIKLTSFMRDSYVKIEGHGMDKLNHAFAFGGPSLAIKTLNQNFGLNIKDYVAVNFVDLAHIIDSLGGITIDVKPYEVKYVNTHSAEVARKTKLKFTPISKSGPQTLDGVQAVGYARIRHIGDGDYERTERQRTVLTQVISKVQSAGVSEIPSLSSTLLPYVETSMTPSYILKLGSEVLTSGTKTVETARFPVDSQSKPEKIKGIYYLVFNIPETKTQVEKYIFENIKPPANTINK